MVFFKRNRNIKLIEDLNTRIEKLNEKLHKLENENNQSRAIWDSMVEGAIAVDKDSKVVSVNPAVEKIFSVSKKEVEGKFFLEAFRNNDISELINNVLKKGELISTELDLVWPLQRIFLCNASPIFDGSTSPTINPERSGRIENNGISGCLVVIHDITEIRRLERMRSDFVANVSHELKTPLTSIKGFVETLLEGAFSDKENSCNFLKIIQNHTERLNSLINDLLDLSYIESKEIALRIEEFKIKALVDEVLSAFKSQINKESIAASNGLSASLLVKADKDRIEQVLVNLVDNAIKFNKEKGSIKIYGQDFDDKVRITVEDSGVGIPPKDIPRIFERFYRV
ncbi:MAG: histidine kinase dimerization/phospho-acceptor domain-containing protein, partial [bacterium]|nr:histidine kinase dimerization/phospho-acceptor domain-containing protein [bacterium]